MSDVRILKLLDDIDVVLNLVDEHGEVGESYMMGTLEANYLGLVTVLLEKTEVLDVRSGVDPILGGVTRIYSRGRRDADQVKAEVNRQWNSWSEFETYNDPVADRIHSELRQLRRI